MRRDRLPTTVLRRSALAAACALTIAILGACTGADADPGGDDPPILQPGKPGEAASTIGPDDLPSPSEWNHADVAFAQMMIPHHAQALEMSELARQHAANPQVKTLARRIKGAQGPEIVALAAWLSERDLEVPTVVDDPEEFDHGHHGHAEMAGILTEQQMKELARARGEKFDRLFLQGMIHHHQGAVDMAQSVGEEGSDLQIGEMAADVAAGQAAEIRKMRQLLAAVS